MRFAVRAVGDIREVRAGAGVEVRFKIGSMGWGRTGLGLGESPGLRSEVGLASAAREGLGWLPLSLLPKARFPLRLGYYGELSWEPQWDAISESLSSGPCPPSVPPATFSLIHSQLPAGQKAQRTFVGGEGARCP